MVTETLDRSRLRMVQTPQAFAFAVIVEPTGAPPRPAATILPTTPRSPNGPAIAVNVFAGETGNVKLTTEDDFVRAEACGWRRSATCAPAAVSTCTRSPTAIMSCSAACASRTTRGVTGHSDADVALHALVDAILGALADGDIGAHFPPSDPQWRGASSDRFLAFAVRARARARRA